MKPGVPFRYVALTMACVLAAISGSADAQSNLGELLDAGAQRVSGEGFTTDIVGRTVVGPLPTGGEVEVLFASAGRIVGRGQSPSYPSAYQVRAAVEGEWRIDDAERVCITARIGTGTFPTRCQYWFKLDDVYYLSDSDSDRRAKVLKRTIKQ